MTTRPMMPRPKRSYAERTQPCCSECLRYITPREDGTAPNHRDQSGDPCEGSRLPVVQLQRSKPKKTKKETP